ncbi:MAG: hypothetical protein RIS51_176 [Actinomycetota bacterium]
MKRKQTPLDQIAESWVQELAKHSPTFATYIGSPQGIDELDDYSPEHESEFQKLIAKTATQIQNTPTEDFADEVTKDAMLASLDLDRRLYEAGYFQRDLNNIASPSQGIRDIFDLAPVATEQDWENIAKRMRKVSDSLSGYMEALELGIQNKRTPAKRQVEQIIEQAGQITAVDGFFRTFAQGAKTEVGDLPETLKKELISAAEDATAGYEKFGQFLANTLMKSASDIDAVGRESYELLSEKFLGAKIDLDETYEWGIAELQRVTREQEKVAKEILPGATIPEAIEHLSKDPARKLHGTDELQKWMQKLSDRAIEELGKTHFDIPEPMRKLECMIAPTQHGGIYYTSPSDDFSRPGRMWWSVPAGVTEFDTWRETTTVYHEGVPGHHLQIAQAIVNREELNSWRRLASWSSGHGEGWALYAERLMEELGYLSDPADRLGMLDGQRMRAARVVLDIGVHLEKPRLDGTGKWDFDYALNFMASNVNLEMDFVKFEVNRYFGWAGQAPAYKVGQRIWEQIRDDYKARKGAGYSIREFHKQALALGGLGLDTLRRSMAKI